MANPLRKVATVEVPAVGTFDVAVHFGEARPMMSHTRGNAAVKIMGLGTNFTQYIMPKSREAVEAATLSAYMVDAAASAGAAPVLSQTALGHVWELLKRQPNGEEGALLTNGKDNVFYAKGTDHQLWAVSAGWNADGWYVDAGLGKYPRWWTQHQVFFR